MGASYLLVRAAASPRRSWWAGYAAAVTLTGLFNLFAVLLAVAHGLSLLAARAEASAERDGGTLPVPPTLRRWLIASGAAAVLIAPLAVYSARQSAQLNWVTRPDLSTVASLLRDFAGASVAIPVIAFAALLGCVAGLGLRRGAGLTLGLVALPWLVVPPLVLLGISLADPVYVERYVVFCLPALAILVAAGLVWLVTLTARQAARRGVSARPGTAARGASVRGNGRGGDGGTDSVRSARSGCHPRARTTSEPWPRSWRLASRPGDAILYLPWDTALAGMAYPKPFANLRNIGLGESPVASDTLRGLPASSEVVASRLHGVARIWTVQWTPVLPSAAPVSLSMLAADGLRLIRRWHIQSVTLSLYAKR